MAADRRARPALQPAARPGLRLDRLRALHAPGRRPRGPLGGQDKTECGLHAERTRARGRRDAIATRAHAPARARGRGDPRDARGRRRAREARAAVLRRQGLDRAAAARREGVRARAVPVPADARRHRAQLPRGHRVPRPPRRRARRELLVASVQASIDAGRVREETGPRASRNRLQTVTLLDAIERARVRRRFGGARRDEERARAKERVLSFRDDFGQWDPRRQRPELWDLYNGRVRRGEHVRAFPISNWTELDVWQYIAAEDLELPSIYFAHEREVFERDGMLYAVSAYVELIDGEDAVHRLGALPHGRRHELHRRGALAPPRRCRGRRRDRRHATSPSAARRAPTTACPRPRWRTASARATSSGPAAARHRRLRRRRQVHADRPPAARRQGGARRPARARRGARAAAGLDLALLTDGLRAEREQGITIDVAYRSFATPRRRFILADCPGPRAVHAQHGHRRLHRRPRAAARRRPRGRHRADAPPRAIAALLRLRHVIVAINKMDLVDYSEERFDDVVRELLELGARGRPARRQLHPDQRAARRQRRRALGARCPGTSGPPLLEHLETVPVEPPAVHGARLPVQLVLRGEGGARWPPAGSRRARCAGRRGRRAARRHAHARRRGARRRRRRPSRPRRRCRCRSGWRTRSTSRAATCSPPPTRARAARELDAPRCAGWATAPRAPGGRFLLKHGTRTVRARLEAIEGRLDVRDARVAGRRRAAAQRHRARARCGSAATVAADPYAQCRATGAFILDRRGDQRHRGGGNDPLARFSGI